MLDVLFLVLPLFGLILLGFVAGRLAGLPLDGLAWLNFFVIYIALPALFFRILSRTPLAEFANFGFIATTIFATLVIFSATFLVAGLRNGGNVAEATIQGFAAAYGNIGYMGPPLALAAFGPQAGVPVALIFCFENAMHFTLAPLLMALHERRHAAAGRLAAEIAGKVFTHPFILATIAGVVGAAVQVELPAPAETLLDVLSGAAAPCALFAMGVTAALRPLKRVPPELAYLLPVKLIVHPALVLVLLATLVPQAPPLWVDTAVLLAALPSATNVFVIAQQYRAWQERASSVVVLSTAAAVVTVTVCIYLAKGGYFAALLG
ncbi:MAG: malonate transporter [Alphaproteobacteria bacterium]|nr:MAG: malonate transporter [Alphaproteobacteria bacterium]